jgi:hypothetical protein
MSRHNPPPIQLPPLGTERQLGDLFRRASLEYGAGLDERAAFRRLSERLALQERPRFWRRRWFSVLALALLATTTLGVWLSRDAGSGPAADSKAPLLPERLASIVPGPSPPTDAERITQPVSEPRVVLPSDDATALAAGKSRFPDGTVASVGLGSVARVRSVQRTTQVVLEQGQIDLDVAKQPAGSRFEVEGGAYRFEVLGTAFRVEILPEQVSLEVSEGTVAVWRGARLVKRVAAGQLWKSADTPEPLPAAASLPARQSQAAAPESDCLGLARSGQGREAEQCFLARAKGSGIGAELALYEVARLRVDVLTDSAGALQALREYAERFPLGSLRQEVAVFRVELLARSGQAREALDGSAALLASAAGGERAAELHVLRGNIYRQTLGDPAAAEREYARAELSGGAAGAEASYLRGLCLEALGDLPAALARYLQYLSVPGRPQERQARSRREQLMKVIPRHDAIHEGPTP